MKKVILKPLAVLLAVVLCLGTFYMGAFAETVVNGAVIADVNSDYLYKTGTCTNNTYTYVDVDVDYAIYSHPDFVGTTQKVAMYVINWGGERIGTKSDAGIINGLLSDGYAVVVLDYKNSSAVTAANMGISTTKIRSYLNTAFTDSGVTNSTAHVYVVPAGYSIETVEYFDMSKHASLGTLNAMVEGWNADIAQKNAYRDKDGNMFKKVSTMDELLEKYGNELDFRFKLYMDIVHPAFNEGDTKVETPVFAIAATQTQRMYNLGTNSNNRQHPNHFLFGGYTFVVFDFGYNCYNFPISHTNNFGTIPQNTAKTSRAAIRCIRYYAESLGYSSDLIGVAGISKGSPAAGFLASKNNADLPEEATFPEDTTGTLVEGGENVIQPYSFYEGGYEGEGTTPISSEVSVSYAAAGSGVYNMWEVWGETEKRPLLLSCGIDDQHGCWSYWFETIDWARNNATEPFLAMSMYDLGHDYPNGTDTVYRYDRIRAFYNFFDQFLKPDTYQPSLVYVYPKNNATEVSVNDTISFKFYGTMDYESVVNGVTIVNADTGEALEGTWSANELNSLYEYKHNGLTAGTRYEIRFAEGIYNADYDSETGAYVKGALTLPAQTHGFIAEGDYAVYPVADTYVDEVNPDTVYGSADTLYVDGTSGAEKIIFATFETKHLSTATKVMLRTPAKSGGAQAVNIYALDGYVVDEATLTYNNMPALEDEDLIGKYTIQDEGITLDITDLAGKVTGDKITLAICSAPGKAYSLSYDFEDMSGALSQDQTSYNRAWCDTAVVRYGGAPSSTNVTTLDDGNKVLLITSTHGYDRVKFYNSFSNTDLTSDDVGKMFNVSLRVMTPSESSLEVGVMSAYDGSGGAGPESTFSTSFYTDAGNTTRTTTGGEWQDISFTVTIDEKMVETQAAMLTINTHGTEDNNLFYVDDIKIEQVAGTSSFASNENTQEKHIVLITDNTYYYTDVDFTEPVYNISGAAHQSAVIVDDKIGETDVKAIKLSRLTYDKNDWRHCFKLADYTGNDQFKVENGKTYIVSYSVKAVTAPDFWVSLDVTASKAHCQYTDSATSGVPKANRADAFSTHSGSATTTDWQTVTQQEYTANADGYLMFSVASKTTVAVGEADIRFANISVVAKTDVTYKDIDANIDVSSYPVSVVATADYSEILPQVNNVMWYLDEACTVPAKGQVNASAVTLYAKYMWYSNIDFNEYVYNWENGTTINGITWTNNATAMVPTLNAGTTDDYSMLFNVIRHNGQLQYGRHIILADQAGTGGFKFVQDGTNYKINYDIKTVNAPYTFKVYVYQSNSSASPKDRTQLGSSATNSAVTTSNANAAYTAQSFSFTPSTTSSHQGAMLVVNYVGSGTSDMACEIYIDNLTIAAQTTFTYNGIEDASALTATAYANEKYEDVLKPLDDSHFAGWYLDPEFTKPATGIINAAKVTLYPKFEYFSTVDSSETALTVGNGAVVDYYGETVIRLNRNYGANNYRSSVWLTNAAGTGDYKVTAGKTYKINYDVLVVKSERDFYVEAVNNSSAKSYSTGTKKTYYSMGFKGAGNTEAIANPKWSSGSVTVTAEYDGYIGLAISNYTGLNREYPEFEVYFDNISIAEQTNITYKGTKTGSEPATAWANQTYEEVLGDIAASWYTDVEKTVNPTGLINTDAVTLYAPYYGIATPAETGLFVHGDSSQNSTITGTTEGSAVYKVGDVEYSAFRVFGEYIAPSVDEENTAPDYTKVIINTNGDTREIVSRHVLLGYGKNQEEPTVDNKYKMSTASGDNLNKCWSKTYNGDGTWTIRYSLLLKNIPKDYRNTEFYANAGIIYLEGDEEVSLYSASYKDGISAQKIYDGTTGYSWYTE